jgi:hypothetical protein
MTVRDPKSCDQIFDEYEYLVAPGMRYRIIDVNSLSLGYRDVFVVSMVSDERRPGDILSRMDA